MSVKVPYNTEGILAGLSKAFSTGKQGSGQGGGTAPKANGTGGGSRQEPADRRSGHERAEHRRKIKELTDKLNSVETTQAEKDALIQQINTELEESKARIMELEPKAKQWQKDQDIKRARLMDRLKDKPELKEGTEGMPLGALETYVNKLTGQGGPAGTAASGKTGTGKDWSSILAGDPTAASKAIADDPTGFNEYVNTPK